LRKISFATVFLLIVFLALSVTAGAREKSESADITKTPVRIAVIPFQALIPEDEQRNTVICPVCGIGLFGGKILNGSEKIVEEIFVEKLYETKQTELIPSDKVQDVYKRNALESLKAPLLNIFKNVGKELEADFLAVGYVYRYIERVGYGYGSEHPASVAFEIH